MASRRQTLVDFGGGALRIDRLAVVGKAGRDQLVPFLAIAVDHAKPFLAGIELLVDILAPVELGEHLAQEGAHVGHQAERNRIIAADLLRIDVDVNEFGRRNGEGVARNPRTRGAVVKADTERQQDVGLARRVIGLVMAAARDHAERERMMGIDRAEPAHRGRDRNLQAFGELQKLLAGAAVTHALADDDARPLGAEQHVDGLHHAFRLGAAAAGNIGAPFLRLRRFLGSRFQKHVERHVQHHRTGTPGHHGLPRLANRKRHHLAAGRLKDLLAAGAHHRRKVRLILTIHFLERAAIELAGRHVAGYGEKRHGVEIGRGERDRQIGRARTA